MTDTTTISKIHNTTLPTYEFEILFLGHGGYLFVDDVKRNQLARFKDVDCSKLSKFLTDRFDTDTLERFTSYNPEIMIAEGIDLSRPHEFVVGDENRNVIYTAECRQYELFEAANDNNIEFIDTSIFDTTKYTLWLEGGFSVTNRYHVRSNNPFNPKLIQMSLIDFDGHRMIEELRYDGVPIICGWPDILEGPYYSRIDEAVNQ